MNESDPLIVPGFRTNMRYRAMRAALLVASSTVLACVALAALGGRADAASGPKPGAFRVTLKATVTKDWDTVTEGTDGGCATSVRSQGRWTATLRSSKPTPVVVVFRSGRPVYLPPTVRHVRIRVSQSTRTTTRLLNPCKGRPVHETCAKARAAVTGRFMFFRSGRNELSFRPTRLPQLDGACPSSEQVRAIQPGLEDAQGRISEAALKNRRVSAQTATGSSRVTTELEGDEAGRVVERVHWDLKFSRVR